MSKNISTVDVAANATFQTLIDTVNLLANTVSNEVVTANNTADGSLTSGNGFVNGIFGSNTLVTSTLRGGVINASANLSIESNVSMSDILTVNTSVSIGTTVTINTSMFALGNSTANIIANTSSLKIGANVYLNTGQFGIGNSTVNLVANSISLKIGSNLIVNTTMVTLGNVTINTTAITIGGTEINATPSFSVANNRTTVGSQPTINFTGSGITVDVTNEPSNNMVTVQLTANGGLSIGGSNTFVQFNDQGGLGGVSALTFDKTSNTLSVANIVSVPVILSSNIARTEAKTVSITTGNNTIDNIFITDHRSAEYLISIKDNSANGYQVSKILVIHDGTNGYVTEYGSLTTNTSLATFDVTSNSTVIMVRAISTISNGTVKFSKTLIAV